MFSKKICVICLFVLLGRSVFHFRCKPGGTLFQVVASRNVGSQSDKAAGRRQPLFDTSPASGITSQHSDLFTVMVMNEVTTSFRQNADVLQQASFVNSKSKSYTNISDHAKTYTEAIGLNSKSNSGTTSKDRKRKLFTSRLENKITTSQLVERVAKLQENNATANLRADVPVESEQSRTSFGQLCARCPLVTIAHASTNQNGEMKMPSFTTLVNTDKLITRTSTNDKTDPINIGVITTTAPAQVTTVSEEQFNFDEMQELQKNLYPEVTRKENVNSVTWTDIESVHQLRMILTSENFTIFCPGGYSECQFQGEDTIVLNDTALSEMYTLFSFQEVDNMGNAYSEDMGSDVNSPPILCKIVGVSEELIYGGWHRWENKIPENMSLNCEGGKVSSNISPTDKLYFTQYALRLDSQKGETLFPWMLELNPSMPGYYICIAVDSHYNVFVSNYHDVQVIRVVSSEKSSIIPLKVTVYENDTQSSFLQRNCEGNSPPQSHVTVPSDHGVMFLYLNKSNVGNVSFTVKYLNEVSSWTRAKPNFENIKLSRPMLISCKCKINVYSDIQYKYLRIYFRHDPAEKKPQKVFTAVANETLSFSCCELVSETLTAAKASYFEGDCSMNMSRYVTGNSSNITITITKQMCLVCSAGSSKIKLQINVEDNLRNKLTNETNKKMYRNCSVLWDMKLDLPLVQNSNQCEQNAISMLNGLPQHHDKTIVYQPFTFMAYYSTRQFIICQSQPIVWSDLVPSNQTSEMSTTSESRNLLAAMICAFVVTIALLILLEWRRKRKLKQQRAELQLENIATPYFQSLAMRSKVDINELSARMDFVHPREIFDRSRILLGALIGRGKFGQVYKANIQCVANHGDPLEVAVKEIKPNIGKSGARFCRIDKEVQIMRMILPHLNVIRYYGFSLNPDSNMLIMELVKGPCLLEYLREQRTRVPGFIIKVNFHTDSTDLVQAALRRDSSLVNIDVCCDQFESENEDNEMKNSNFFHREANLIDNHDKVLDDAHHKKYSKSFVEVLRERAESILTQVSVDNDISHTNISAEGQGEHDNLKYSNEQVNRIPFEFMAKEMVSICRQVALGMSHIASLNVIHCDLAARNVIVQSTIHPLVVKICDFGMAQSLAEGETIYKGDGKGPRPFRWMSPEALNKGEYSVFSDVWSYGVLCWEVLTLGSTPYGKMPTFAAAAKVAAGQHLPRPSNCDAEIFAVLKSCWKVKPTERSSFTNLENRWSDILEANSDYLELIADGNDVSC